MAQVKGFKPLTALIDLGGDDFIHAFFDGFRRNRGFVVFGAMSGGFLHGQFAAADPRIVSNRDGSGIGHGDFVGLTPANRARFTGGKKKDDRQISAFGHDFSLVDGGPGRNRTRDQTVMSGPL